jgi:hypothetical protein
MYAIAAASAVAWSNFVQLLRPSSDTSRPDPDASANIRVPKFIDPDESTSSSRSRFVSCWYCLMFSRSDLA